MEIEEIISSPYTKRIYDNYNTLFRYKHEIIIKKYADEWRLKKEIGINAALKAMGYPYIQEILSISPPYVAFKFEEEHTFAYQVKQGSICKTALLETANLLPAGILAELDTTPLNKRKDRINKTIDKLNEEGIIGTETAERMRAITSNYQPTSHTFIHGDLRPDNIIGNSSLKCYIDFELAEMGDHNKDLAYLYMGTVTINPDYRESLLKLIQKQNKFDEKAFRFYAMCFDTFSLINPQVDKQKILQELDLILA